MISGSSSPLETGVLRFKSAPYFSHLCHDHCSLFKLSTMSISTEVIIAIVLGVPSLLVAVLSALFAYLAVKQGRRKISHNTQTHAHHISGPVYECLGCSRQYRPPAHVNLIFSGFDWSEHNGNADPPRESHWYDFQGYRR